MAKKKQSVPEYGTVTRKGTLYYRTRITDADGKQVSLYATTCEELYEKQLEARRQVEEIIFRRKHPTVAEYCEKWLLMQSLLPQEDFHIRLQALQVTATKWQRMQVIL